MAGTSFSMANLLVPAKKADILNKAEKEVHKIEPLYIDGIITDGERYNKIISTWFQATAEVSSCMMKELAQEDIEAFENKINLSSRLTPSL